MPADQGGECNTILGRRDYIWQKERPSLHTTGGISNLTGGLSRRGGRVKIMGVLNDYTGKKKMRKRQKLSMGGSLESEGGVRQLSLSEESRTGVSVQNSGGGGGAG